jgi:hypothetical protein
MFYGGRIMIPGYKINMAILQEAINFLAEHPYKEVFELIHVTQRSSIRISQEEYLVREEVQGALLNYLSKKQYSQVARYITALTTSPRGEVDETQLKPMVEQVTAPEGTTEEKK